jgi:PAS domain-containing protein
VIGVFNFMPVKTFDAEEVELLEKRLTMSLCFRSFEKKFKIKNGRSKVRKDTILLRRFLLGIFRMDVAGLTIYVNPSWCQISGLSFQEALNGWLNAVHDDDKSSNY